jgi:hypothetical protein
MLKLHICPSHLEPKKYKVSFPICGKVSDAIEFDTVSLDDFLKADPKRQCVRCMNKINSK